MPIRPIRTDKDHRAALAEIDKFGERPLGRRRVTSSTFS